VSKAPSTFRETNVKRFVRAVRAAGLEIGSVEVDKLGNIKVIPGKPTEAIATGAGQ